MRGRIFCTLRGVKALLTRRRRRVCSGGSCESIVSTRPRRRGGTSLLSREWGDAPPGDAAEALSRTDALLHMGRAFEREDVPHPKGSVDLARDIKAFDEEMAFNDLGIIERRLEKLDITVRSARPGGAGARGGGEGAAGAGR